jgi:hypothetical protein
VGLLQIAANLLSALSGLNHERDNDGVLGQPLGSRDETLGRFEGCLLASRTLAHTIGRLGDPAEVFAALPFMVGL